MFYSRRNYSNVPIVIIQITTIHNNPYKTGIQNITYEH